MPTQNVNLTDRQSAFIQSVIEEGSYASASEVVRDGLRVLEQRRQEDKLKLEQLREMVKVGFDQLGRGEGIKVPLGEIRTYLHSISQRTRAQNS